MDDAPAAAPVPAPIPVSGAGSSSVSAPVPLKPIPTTGPVASEPVAAEPATPEPAVQPASPRPIPSKPSTGRNGGGRPVPVGAAQASAGGKAAPVLLKDVKKAGQTRVTASGWKHGRKAVGVREELDELEEEGALTLWWRDVCENHRSLAVSMLVHVALIVGLGLYVLTEPDNQISLVSYDDSLTEEQVEEIEEFEIVGPEIQPVGGDIVDRLEIDALEPDVDDAPAMEGIDAASQELVEVSLEKAPYNDLLCEVGLGTGMANARGTGKGKRGTGYGLNGSGGGMGGRGGRRGNAIGNGATKESEEAVDLALQWLANHQLPDGGWSFHHQLAPSCQGKCPNEGSLPEARIAATAYGVLPFLGAGQTHQVGKYKRTVGMGLNALIHRMKIDPKKGGSLYEPGGRMYSHGLATIALCEAYGMQVEMGRMKAPKYGLDGHSSPHDDMGKIQKPVPVPGLGQAAQLALNYIMYAQDPNGGGWRYEPRQAGDTSVVGWQLMALLSGKMAYLVVDPRCFARASHYLDHVQTDEYGSDYGYTSPDRKTQATQAIGLLSRMYLGWGPDHQGIVQGVQQMSAAGPSRNNMYYSYYATQVVHHYGGDEWERWNPQMRDSLVNSQSKDSHTAGSWFFGGGHSEKGGRLYCTAMAAMTLEVYYRHMPLYQKGVLQQNKMAQDEKNPDEERPHDEF